MITDSEKEVIVACLWDENTVIKISDWINSTGLPDNVIKSIALEARKNRIKKVCLFGSRARGDYEEKSDIDLAVYGGDLAAFRLDIEEAVPTLLSFDTVDMEKTTSKELKDIVDREGIILYEEI